MILDKQVKDASLISVEDVDGLTGARRPQAEVGLQGRRMNFMQSFGTKEQEIGEALSDQERQDDQEITNRASDSGVLTQIVTKTTIKKTYPKVVSAP